MQTETADRISQLTQSALEQLQHNLAAGKSETLKAYLATMARFHRYSFGNQLLIAFQNPLATHVAGFHAWQKLGRFVKKGEKGITIIAPCVRRLAAAETSDDPNAKTVSKVFGFRGATVFDISQTDGIPLPEFPRVGGDPSYYFDRLLNAISDAGIVLRRVTSLGGAMGVSTGGEIHVLSSLDRTSMFCVLVHEFAHELMHKSQRRAATTLKIRETEAEAVAFVVSHAIGLETGTASSDYMALYNGDIETLSASLELIRDTASSIIASLKVNEPVIN